MVANLRSAPFPGDINPAVEQYFYGARFTNMNQVLLHQLRLPSRSFEKRINVKQCYFGQTVPTRIFFVLQVRDSRMILARI
jgi:hypothetical protein